MAINSGTYYDEKQLKMILGADGESKHRIFMPNEVFSDLVKCEDFKSRKANANHIAFAFSYLYLASYMYRYASFTFYDRESGENFIDDKVMYMICNTSPDSRGKDGKSYITKKQGILSKLGYLRKEGDYPIDVRFYTDEYGITDYSFVDWVMYSEQNKTTGTFDKPRARKINFPVRGIYGDEQSERENEATGYFYQFENTTEIYINIFIFCMKHSDIGVVGFYLYSFIKCMNGYFRGEYNSPIEQLVVDTGIKSTKLSEVLTTLEAHNMITSSHNTFVPGLSQDKRIPANGYRTLDRTQFTDSRRKVEVRKVMSQAAYERTGGKYLYNDSSIEDDDDDEMNDLPF
ncbi:hypothetical protein [Paenibacillus sp. 2TAB19]|uniref:hypothetical protein n=1 Tax=Paenibacillus sp. 2TAB19 TaxID=3233003 RepID=UPI003F95E532